MNNVPRLDLAPKLKRPLSLKNPFDYLLLLYWVFFFPQAVRWYVEKYFEVKKTFKERLQYFLTNYRLRGLILQSIVLIILPAFIIQILTDYFKSDLIPLKSIILISITFFSLGFYTGKITLGIVLGIVFSVSASLESSILNQGFPWFYTVAISFNVMLAISSGIPFNFFAFGPLFGLFISYLLAILLILFITLLVIFKYATFSSSGWILLKVFSDLAWVGITWAILNIRLDNVLICLIGKLLSKTSLYNLPRTTSLPLPNLYPQIVQWLRDDWETGVNNINELLKYTLQFIPVIRAINKFLDEIPEDQTIYYLNSLVEKPYTWDLIFVCISPVKKLMKFMFIVPFINPIQFVIKLFSPFKDIGIIVQIQNNDFTNYNSRHFIADGLFLLYESEPESAKKVFYFIKELPHGQELFLLADIFSNLTSNYDYLNYIISVELPKEELIRQNTWQVINQFKKIAQDTLLTEKSSARLQRSLANNRAIGELEKILENPNSLPELERAMIIDIAQDWQRKLAQNASVIGDDSILEPVVSPYVIGDPVIGQLFVGREDIIRQLQETWLAENHTQSILLFGHRRMGKTSILMNISDKLGSKVKLAYINLNGLGDIAGVDEVFMSITDAISETLNIAPPQDQDLIQSPYRTFKRYLKQIAQNNLTEYNLIIALDEFETLESLIQSQKISSEFLGFLRSMMQLSPKIGFALAGLHTLDEMTADYFQPFFASIIPIRVNFLSEGATRQLLANPNDEFPLDYQPEVLDLIYQLTSGQPYLAQLIGFFLVRRYNNQVFEMGKPRDPILTTEDVNAIINHSEFFKNGRYYFTGVWGQASQNAPAQQEILRAIAPYPQGLDILSIEAITGIDQTTLEIALKTLERHDVIQEKTGKWSIIVELFRRWVEQEKTSNS